MQRKNRHYINGIEEEKPGDDEDDGADYGLGNIMKDPGYMDEQSLEMRRGIAPADTPETARGDSIEIIGVSSIGRESARNLLDSK